MNLAICSGKTDHHIEYRELADHSTKKRSVGLQADVWLAFEVIKKRAEKQGIQLVIASGFRDFDRQLRIWNDKARGRRPVLDHDGKVIDISRLSAQQLSMAILRWSALPGASRHHWGTDFDVYDGAQISDDYSLQLSPEEYAVNGPFAALNEWLEEQAKADQLEGFFRPYSRDTGGIAPEPWHLSYGPLARLCQQAFSVDAMQHCVDEIQGDEMQLAETVRANLPSIYSRFIEVDYELYPV